jgi:lipopolysaccharide biosynthesis regulator YciM
MAEQPGKVSADLPQEALWRLERCDGYLDLGMKDRARAEIEQVPEPYQASPLFQQARLRLAMEEHDWPTAVSVARRLCDGAADKPAYWVQLAYATRRAESIEAAHSILLEGLRRFPKIAVIPFNLACYECQLGHMDSAVQYLESACKLDEAYRDLAQEDEDLRPLWPRLGR